MSRIGRIITTSIALVGGTIVGKLAYNLISDKKRSDDDLEFFDDIDDDLTSLRESNWGRDSSSKEDARTDNTDTTDTTGSDIEDEAPIDEDTKETQAKKPQAKKSQPKKTQAKKSNPKSKTSDKARELTCQDVIDCTANVLNVSSEDILSKSRKGQVASARRVAIYIATVRLNMTPALVCQEFGGIAPSSVSNAKKLVGQMIESDDEFAADIENITDELKQLEASSN